MLSFKVQMVAWGLLLDRFSPDTDSFESGEVLRARSAPARDAARVRPDAVGLAGVLSGITTVHQNYFAAGGLRFLVGDGTLTYGWEQLLKVYYNAQIWKQLYAAVDYQFIVNPGNNRDRGPVSVLGMRLHWMF